MASAGAIGGGWTQKQSWRCTCPQTANFKIRVRSELLSEFNQHCILPEVSKSLRVLVELCLRIYAMFHAKRIQDFFQRLLMYTCKMANDTIKTDDNWLKCLRDLQKEKPLFTAGSGVILVI